MTKKRTRAGRALAAWREKIGITKREHAARLQIDESTLARLESGVLRWQPEQINAIVFQLDEQSADAFKDALRLDHMDASEARRKREAEKLQKVLDNAKGRNDETISG